MITRAILVFLLLSTITARSADTSTLHVAVLAEADNGLSGKLVSLLSNETRRLEGVNVVDESPQYRISCSVITLDMPNVRGVGYAASVVVTSADGHLLLHFVHADKSLESLAHEVALTIDGGLLERARRANGTPLNRRR